MRVLSLVPGSGGFISALLLVSIFSAPDSALAGQSTPASQPPIPKSERPSTAIDRLDDQFRRCYKESKAEILKTESPIMILIDRKVVLYRDGEREERQYVPQQWDVFKTIDHLALGTFVSLINHVDSELPPETMEELRRLKELSGPALDALLGTEIGARQLERQKSMVKRSVDFIDEVVAKREVSSEQLAAFASGMRADSMANAYDAVDAELSKLDEVVRSFKDEIKPDQWNRLIVVVTGPHMPRDQEHKVMYFSALLGEKELGHRVIYLENAQGEAQALDIVATHALDSKIARAYFGDQMRMHRDLLSDVARKYLNEHPAR